jgi:hypothetical protein
MTVPIVGPLAGRRLEQVRQHLGRPPRLVLGLQPGVPFSSPSNAHQLATAAGLVVAMRRFEHVTVLVTGDLGVTRKCFWVLARAVDCFSVAAQADADRLLETYRLARQAVNVEQVAPYPLRRASGLGRHPLPGLYQPGPVPGLSLVDLPETTPAHRARARARRFASSLAGRAHNTGRAAPRLPERAN